MADNFSVWEAAGCTVVRAPELDPNSWYVVNAAALSALTDDDPYSIREVNTVESFTIDWKVRHDFGIPDYRMSYKAGSFPSSGLSCTPAHVEVDDGMVRVEV